MPTIVAPDGCELYFEREGAGAPAVLIPGLGGDGRFWKGVVGLLRDRFDCLVVDHRGAGRSARPLGDYSIELISRDVLAVMDHVGIDRTHLVGHSTGGTIVQTLALDATDRTRSLVISGSWDRPDARFRMAFEARAALLEAGMTETYQNLTHVFGYDHAWLDANEQELSRLASAASESLAPLAVTAARVRMLLGFDRSAELGRLRQATLIVGARDDALIPIHHARRLNALIAHSELEVLEGAHFHPRYDPLPFAERVARFLLGQGRG